MGIALIAIAITFVTINLAKTSLLPINAEDIAQMTFEINPYNSGNCTITDERRIGEIIDSINDIGSQDPDAKVNNGLTTYQVRCWYGDGSSAVIRIVDNDVLVAYGKDEKEKSYTADCTKLVILLNATYWDRLNGVIE
jgi:hypothetical protein